MLKLCFFFLKDIVPVPPLPNSVNPIMYGGLFKTPSNFVAPVEPRKENTEMFKKIYIIN